MTNDRYLFRGFHKEENGKEIIYIDGQAIKGKWVFGYLVEYIQKDTVYMNGTSPKESYIFPMDERSQLKSLEKRIKVIPETIGQYVDETDSYGHKLFWNDEIVVPELNNRVVTIDNKYVFSIIKNFIDNGTDFYYFKTIFDKEVKDND